jgi:hypothetical protein
MKTFLIAVVFIFSCTSMSAQGIKELEIPSMLVYKISLETPSNIASLEALTRKTPQTPYLPTIVTNNLQIDKIPFNKLPIVYTPGKDIMPSIETYFGSQRFNFVNDDFESRFRIDNRAFFEANRNTAMGLHFGGGGGCITPIR